MNASPYRNIHPSAADLLPPEAKRHVRPPLRPITRRPEVVDAVFETIGSAARSNASASHARSAQGRSSSRTANAPMPAALSVMERMLGRLSLGAFAALTGVLCLLAFLIGSQVSAGPAAAMRVEAVETRLTDVNGMRVVSVYGAVVNGSGETRSVPAIEVDLTGPAGLVRVDGQLAGIGPLAPGESRRFTARLPHAGGSLPRVEVSLAPVGAPAR
ncbi:hypothetical protein ACLE20_08560 [Rhizobium sp. YIM 134829]|uniref:hypothetical protein n=1 Tax=Rhizobium sp. YIM 134829 TaxID=3390453 RepID=UPI00397B7C01